MSAVAWMRWKCATSARGVGPRKCAVGVRRQLVLLLSVSDQVLSLQIVVRWRSGRVGRVVERLVGVVGVMAAVGRVVFPG